MPVELYEAATLDRDEQIKRVSDARGRAEKERIKTEIAVAIAAVLDLKLIEHIPDFSRAADLALAPVLEGV